MNCAIYCFVILKRYLGFLTSCNFPNAISTYYFQLRLLHLDLPDKHSGDSEQGPHKMLRVWGKMNVPAGRVQI